MNNRVVEVFSSDQEDFDEMRALMRQSPLLCRSVAEIVRRNIEVEIAYEDQQNEIAEFKRKIEASQREEFAEDCVAKGLCPRCLNLGDDAPLDMLGHCARCDWQHKEAA